MLVFYILLVTLIFKPLEASEGNHLLSMYEAVKQNDFERVDYLRQAGLSLDITGGVFAETPLAYALRTYKFDDEHDQTPLKIVENVVRRGGSCVIADSHGYLPLHQLAFHDKREAGFDLFYQVLKNSGNNVWITSSTGLTPLDRAIEAKNLPRISDIVIHLSDMREVILGPVYDRVTQKLDNKRDMLVAQISSFEKEGLTRFPGNQEIEDGLIALKKELAHIVVIKQLLQRVAPERNQ